MKHKIAIFIVIILALACLTFVVGTGDVINEGFAKADTLVFSVASITAINQQGETTTISDGVWASHISINYNCNYPYLRLFLSSASGWTSQTDYIVPQGTYTLEIPQEGIITIIGRVYDNHKIEQQDQTITTVVYMDNTKPSQPDIDLVALDTYHINPFALRFKVHRDNFSGINYYNSWLGFAGENQDSTIQPTPLATLIPPSQREQDNYIDIHSNGVLTIYLVDYAGNTKECSYTYSKHGVPQSGKPTITINTEAYAKAITVTINWGAGYDDNPYAAKKYAIVTSNGAFPYDYKGAITIDTEGEIQLIVYYYENGEQKSVVKTINNVDNTPPSLASMQSSASLVCDVMSAQPAIFMITATDRLSGIKRLYFKTGGELTKQDNGYYSAPIMDMYNFTVVAEDKAGNKTEYTYYNRYFDFSTLKQANQKFIALDRADYTAEGWAEIEKACDALSMLLLDDEASSSDIAARSRAIDTAIQGEIKVVYKTGSFPAGLDSGIVFGLDPASTNALKGETVSVRLEQASGSNLAKQAGELSGIKKRKVYPFAITIMGINADVALVGSLDFNLALPQGAKGGKIYVVQDGTLKELSTYTKDNRLYATTDTVGDFYLVAERIGNDGVYIGDRLYTWSLLAITAAIIVGVCLVGFVATLIFGKRKSC